LPPDIVPDTGRAEFLADRLEPQEAAAPDNPVRAAGVPVEVCSAAWAARAVVADARLVLEPNVERWGAVPNLDYLPRGCPPRPRADTTPSQAQQPPRGASPPHWPSPSSKFPS